MFVCVPAVVAVAVCATGVLEPEEGGGRGVFAGVDGYAGDCGYARVVKSGGARLSFDILDVWRLKIGGVASGEGVTGEVWLLQYANGGKIQN